MSAVGAGAARRGVLRVSPFVFVITPILYPPSPLSPSPLPCARGQLVNGDVMRETFVHLQKQPSFFMSLVANLYQYLFVFLLMYVLLYTLVAINENAFFDARYVPSCLGSLFRWHLCCCWDRHRDSRNVGLF
jgi:hypothetical protein